MADEHNTENPPGAPVTHRTQFDDRLLSGSVGAEPAANRNHGRQVLALSDGSTVVAVAWGGEAPVLRVWRGHQLVADRALPGQPSAPCLVADTAVQVVLWMSVGDTVCTMTDLEGPLCPLEGLAGVLQDVTLDASGRAILALLQDGRLSLAAVKDGRVEQAAVDDGAGRACLDCDDAGALHLAYEKRQGIEYRRLDTGSSLSSHEYGCAERVAEAFGFHPALLAYRGKVILAYLGESCRPPSVEHHGDAWQRLGRGGYVAALVRQESGWQRFRLADSEQIVKTIRPIDEAHSGGQNAVLRVRVEEFGPPGLVLGPDSVPQVLWANPERRWIYASRFLGEDFSPAAEVRGPVEQLTGPCLVPRHVPEVFRSLPIGVTSQTRTYLDELSLPTRRVDNGRRIDFLQPDELAECRGLELAVNQLMRHPENPVIPIGQPGSFDDGAVVTDIHRDCDGWRADYFFITVADRDRGWDESGRAVSVDGVHWTKLQPLPLKERYVVDGQPEHACTIRFVEDPDEKDPLRRYKGLLATKPGGVGARNWVPVVSPDRTHWSRVKDPAAVINADDDLQVWKDPDDVPERSFKVSAIGWSHCGRICPQWTSPDGVHWHGERDTLDFEDPFGARPDRCTVGRILVDAWAGPLDEDEIHGGFVFRDGGRWLVHYMKWTCDGHIYLALASSRDGINFTRVGGGAPTLPLGEAGTWDAGRVAIRESPFRVGDVWRQYYTGCGWKHGLGGRGSRTSPFGINCPNQTGLAEIPVGHWAHLQLARGSDQGELTTIAFSLALPQKLTADVEGLSRRGSSVAAAIVDSATGDAVEGFDFDACDPIAGDGGAVSVTWKGKGLESLGSRGVRVAVRIAGPGLKLYGLNLSAAE